MKRLNLIKKFAFFLSTLSCSVIIFSPLAMAKQVENERSEALKQVLSEMGVAKNKKITYGEMWSNVRHYFPAHLQSRLDVLVSYSKNETVPPLSVSEVKVGNQTIPRVTFQIYGQTVNLELYGDDDPVMKFNGKSLSLQELFYGGKGFNELVKKDQVAKIDVAKARANMEQTTGNMDLKTWKKMSKEQKAEYFIYLRSYLEATQKVLDLENVRLMKQGDKTKSSLLEKQMNQLMKILVGEPAEAGREDAVREMQKKQAEETALKEKNKIKASQSERVGVQLGRPCGDKLQGQLDGNMFCNDGKWQAYKKGEDCLSPKDGFIVPNNGAYTVSASNTSLAGTVLSCNSGKLGKTSGPPPSGNPGAEFTGDPGKGPRGANGVRVGTPCIIAGYHDGSYRSPGPLCGAQAKYIVEPNKVTSDCRNSSELQGIGTPVIQCNPLLYPAPGSSGGSVCAPYTSKSIGQNITRDYCGKNSPIDTMEQKQAIVQALLANDGKPNLAGNVKIGSCEQTNTNGAIQTSEMCNKLFVDSAEAADAVDGLLAKFKDSIAESKKICDKVAESPGDYEVPREGGGQQQTACAEQMKRQLAIEKFIKDITTSGGEDGKEKEKCFHRPGMQWINGKCECVKGSLVNGSCVEETKQEPAVVTGTECNGGSCGVIRTTDTGIQDKKPWTMPFWGKALIVGGLIAGILWLLLKTGKRKKRTPPVYVPPYVDPTSPVIEPPPPTTQPPPAIDEGGSGLSGATGGGVR